jgi:hypothetical protein
MRWFAQGDGLISKTQSIRMIGRLQEISQCSGKFVHLFLMSALLPRSNGNVSPRAIELGDKLLGLLSCYPPHQRVKMPRNAFRPLQVRVGSRDVAIEPRFDDTDEIPLSEPLPQRANNGDEIDVELSGWPRASNIDQREQKDRLIDGSISWVVA